MSIVLLLELLGMTKQLKMTYGIYFYFVEFEAQAHALVEDYNNHYNAKNLVIIFVS